MFPWEPLAAVALFQTPLWYRNQAGEEGQENEQESSLHNGGVQEREVPCASTLALTLSPGPHLSVCLKLFLPLWSPELSAEQLCQGTQFMISQKLPYIAVTIYSLGTGLYK